MNRLSWCVVMFLLGSQLFPFPRGQDSPSEAGKEQNEPGFHPAVIPPAKRMKSEGYRAVISYGDGFLAAGSGGRMDHISLSGEIVKSETFPGEDFNSLLSDNQTVIAAGDNGALWISSVSGKFRKIESGTGSDINSLTAFNGKIIAGADHGEIIEGNFQGSFQKIKPGLKGNILSVSAGRSGCYGVTDTGEIVHSADGLKWDITDFNRVYAGYYKPCRFSRVLVTENRIAVSGYRDDGSPVMMLSSRGNVWTERPLNYKNDGEAEGYLREVPNDILYDEADSRFYMACNNGKLMVLPSCSHCNIVAEITVHNLEGISSNNDAMVVVGENFFVKVLNIK